MDEILLRTEISGIGGLGAGPAATRAALPSTQEKCRSTDEGRIDCSPARFPQRIDRLGGEAAHRKRHARQPRHLGRGVDENRFAVSAQMARPLKRSRRPSKRHWRVETASDFPKRRGRAMKNCVPSDPSASVFRIAVLST